MKKFTMDLTSFIFGNVDDSGSLVDDTILNKVPPSAVLLPSHKKHYAFTYRDAYYIYIM